jgi:hypothetical protein
MWYNLLAKEKPHHMVKNGPDEEYHETYIPTTSTLAWVGVTQRLHPCFPWTGSG